MVGSVAAVGRAWSGGGEDEADGGIEEVYRDRQVRVVSDEKIPEAQAKALANRIERAWAFDQQQQKWEDPAPLNQPLTVAVLSRGAFGRLTGDTTGATAGVTTGPDVFAVPDRVLGRRSAQDENTIAHELGHVQDLREGGERISLVPIYLQEGKEYVLGETYPLKERLKNPHLAYVGDALAKVSGDDAAWLLKNFRKASDEQRGGNVGFFGEVTGALFVEYLRVQENHPNAVAAVADVIADVGRGESYEKAFREHFGTTAKQAEDAFVEFMRRTERNPEARLAGTIFDPKRTTRPRPS